MTDDNTTGWQPCGHMGCPPGLAMTDESPTFETDPDPDDDPECDVAGCTNLAPVTAESDEFGSMAFHYCNRHAEEKFTEHPDLYVVDE